MTRRVGEEARGTGPPREAPPPYAAARAGAALRATVLPRCGAGRRRSEGNRVGERKKERGVLYRIYCEATWSSPEGPLLQIHRFHALATPRYRPICPAHPDSSSSNCSALLVLSICVRGMRAGQIDLGELVLSGKAE